MNSTDKRLYYEWLASVCVYVEELMDCTAEAQFAEAQPDALILRFKPFGRVVWCMRFEDVWLLRGYKNNANPKSIARSMAIITREEWAKVIVRKDKPND